MHQKQTNLCFFVVVGIAPEIQFKNRIYINTIGNMILCLVHFIELLILRLTSCLPFYFPYLAHRDARCVLLMWRPLVLLLCSWRVTSEKFRNIFPERETTVTFLRRWGEISDSTSKSCNCSSCFQFVFLSTKQLSCDIDLLFCITLDILNPLNTDGQLLYILYPIRKLTRTSLSRLHLFNYYFRNYQTLNIFAVMVKIFGLLLHTVFVHK